MSAQSVGFPPTDGGHSPGFSRGVEHVLPVDAGHRLWWIEGGAGIDRPPAAGAPVVLVLHGGPGGQTRPATLDWWDGLPLRWLALDQRGCGRSTPAGHPSGQTLAALVADLEQLRRAAGVDRWALAGGSWGARLALAYAVRHPQRLSGLWLRSPFLGSQAETARYIAPWLDWLGPAGRAALGPSAEAVAALYRGTAEAAWRAAARAGQLPAVLDTPALVAAWQAFDDQQSAPGGVPEQGVDGSRLDPARLAPAAAPSEAARAAWRIHALHGLQAWGCDDAQGAWSEARQLATLGLPGPVALVGGDEDRCCDPAVRDGLAALWPQAPCTRVPGAGHRMGDPRLAPALAASARAWALRLVEGGARA